MSKVTVPSVCRRHERTRYMQDLMRNQFYKQRSDFELSAIERDKTQVMPEGVSVQTDIPYMNDGDKAHRMDVYRPEGSEDTTLPVVINIHGGGLLIGSKEFNRFFCAKLSRLGYLVFSIEYRLVPDCMVFDQFSDVCNAFKYINAHLGEYNGDSNHIYGVADSGGAYLLTYTAAMAKNRELAKAAHVKPQKFSFRAIGLISGMFYTNRFDKIGLFLPAYLYGKNYKKQHFAKYVNPENPDIVTSLPPCFLITSQNDNLRKYTLDFEKALARHNMPHEFFCFPRDKRLTHAFSVFRPDYEESEDTIMAMHNYFEKYK